MAKDGYEELKGLADRQLKSVKIRLPRDPTQRFVMFTDICRFLDAVSVSQSRDAAGPQKAVAYDLIQSGWNLAASLLLSPLPIANQFPLSESTEKSLAIAQSILRNLGIVVVIRRAAELVRSKLINAEVDGDRISLRHGNLALAGIQIDSLEQRRWAEFEESLGQPTSAEAKIQRQREIDALMRPLVRPWLTKRGAMVAYDASPEVDEHYIEMAMRDCELWRDEAGVHPSVQVGGVPGNVVGAVIMLASSFHLKHARFVSLAAESYAEISVPQSLTIWKRRTETIATLAAITGISAAEASRAINVLALRADEARNLAGILTPLRPLLIDLGNGLDLWPVSALSKNPFLAVRAIQEMREPNLGPRLAAPREEWQRSNLYGLFQGSRYECVSGNVKVRLRGQTMTDIDAAIFDTSSNELALFQLKWQDFHTNDPREIVSKSKNFMEGMRTWSNAVRTWSQEVGFSGVKQALRIRDARGGSPGSVLIFGLAHHATRLSGYSRTEAPEAVALASWSQFLRARYEMGPVENVFSRLHESFITQWRTINVSQPFPVTMKVDGVELHFADFWHAIDSAK